MPLSVRQRTLVDENASRMERAPPLVFALHKAPRELERCSGSRMIAMRVLLVADRGDVGESTVARLKKIGYAVGWAIKGTDADNLLSYKTYDLIILDLTLQDIDGLYLLKQLRQRGSSTPALVLTARSATHERIKALDLGADDYLIKPFDYRELEARARALLRRANSGISTKKWSCGNMVVDRNTR